MANLGKQYIMLIEDSDIDYIAIMRTFKKVDITYKLKRFSTCEDAWQLLNHLNINSTERKAFYLPSLIVLDLSMPGIDGRDFLLAIKEHPILRQIPVVVMTTSDNREDIAFCYSHGANSYIKKPDNIEALTALLINLCDYWLKYCESYQIDPQDIAFQSEMPPLGMSFKQHSPEKMDDHSSVTSLKKIEQYKIQIADLKQALNSSQQRFDHAMQGSQNGVWEWQINTENAWWSDQYYRNIGFEPNEIECNLATFKAILHPDDIERTFKIIDTYIQNGGVFEIEHRFKTKHDGYQWFKSIGKAYYDQFGTPLTMTGSMQNIHHKKIAEKETYANDQRLGIAAKLANIGIWDWFVAGDKLILHEGMHNIFSNMSINFGYRLSAFSENMYAEDIPIFEADIQHALECSILNNTYRFIFPSSELKYINLIAKVLYDDNQQPIQMTGICRDVTDERQSQAAREVIERQYHTVLEQVTDGWWDWEIGTEQVYFSSNYKSLFGYKDDELKNNMEAWQRIIAPEDLDKALKLLELHLQHGTPYILPVRYINKNGSITWVICRGVAVRNEKNELTRMIGTHIDITKLKETEGKLERSNSALREFAYLASHDLKEPLRGINNYVNFIIEDYKDCFDETGNQYLSSATQLCQNMMKKLDGLLYYSQINESELAVAKINIAEIVGDVIEELSAFINEHQVIINVDNHFPEIVADKHRVQEVFYNLITNAIKYNVSTPKIIEVGCQEKTNQPTQFFVKDNGVGIKEMFHEKIFDLFKRGNNCQVDVDGTGIGLTLIKNIIERHGGKIWVESTYQKGSTFFFTLKG